MYSDNFSFALKILLTNDINHTLSFKGSLDLSPGLSKLRKSSNSRHYFYGSKVFFIDLLYIFHLKHGLVTRSKPVGCWLNQLLP